MNERIEKLIKVAKERMVLNNESDKPYDLTGLAPVHTSDHGLSNFFELRDRLEDLLDESEIAELDQAWEQMLREVKLEEWDEDFLKAIDGSYESRYLYGYTTKRQEVLNHKRKEQEYKQQLEMQKQQMEMQYRAAQNATPVFRTTTSNKTTGGY